MTFNFRLGKPVLRIGLLLLTAAVCVVLGFLVTKQYIIETFEDPRLIPNRAEVESAVRLIPDSSVLQALSAEIELAQGTEHEPTAARAVAAARRAVELSPKKFGNLLLLASACELDGDQTAAEKAMRRAAELAPANLEVRWKLANFLVRTGKLNQALPEFRIATGMAPRLLQPSLELLWQVSNGDINAMDAATGTTPAAQLGLAFFLLQQFRVTESAAVYRRIDRKDKIHSTEAGSYLNVLIKTGLADIAYPNWLELVAGEAGTGDQPLNWNGSFETDPMVNLTQFDWKIAGNQYANIGFDPNQARHGSRSLRIDFLGRDTTRLDKQIEQTILVTPGAKYRLEYFTRTLNYSAPEGPRVAISSPESGKEIAASEPVASGSSGWQSSSLEFTGPPESKIINLTIRRTPKYSYDDPSRGTIWFDDFKLIEIREIK